MKKFQIIILVSLLVFNRSTIIAQISAPEAMFSDTTEYVNGMHQNHDIFVFAPTGAEDQLYNLYAEGPSTENYSFVWSHLDTVSMNWVEVHSNAAASFSNYSADQEGGYRVKLSNGSDIDTTYYAWVYENNLKVSVLKGLDDKLLFGKYSCGVIYLNASIELDDFVYFDPTGFERHVFSNDFVYKWTSDNDEFIIKPNNVGLEYKTVTNPPTKDSWIILTATDSTGIDDVDSVFYESVEVEADFSMEFFDKKDTEDYIVAPGITEDDAPLKIRFTNNSLNGYSFEWIFTDTSNAKVLDIQNEFTENMDYKPEYTYKIPDYYFPALVAKSEENCVDTFKLDNPVIVFPSDLEAPNVFSPEGLEKNRYFKVSFQSIKEFHIRIFSKTGNLVYKDDITNLHSWDGWDGNIMNSSRPAPAGVYYFVIEATGYDEIRYNHKPYTGFVYLYRPK